MNDTQPEGHAAPLAEPWAERGKEDTGEGEPFGAVIAFISTPKHLVCR